MRSRKLDPRLPDVGLSAAILFFTFAFVFSANCFSAPPPKTVTKRTVTTASETAPSNPTAPCESFSEDDDSGIDDYVLSGYRLEAPRHFERTPHLPARSYSFLFIRSPDRPPDRHAA